MKSPGRHPGVTRDWLEALAQYAALFLAPLLPEGPRNRLRDRFGLNLGLPALAVGLVQATLCLVLLVGGFIGWEERQFGEVLDATLTAVDVRSEGRAGPAEEDVATRGGSACKEGSPESEVSQGFFMMGGPLYLMGFLMSPLGLLAFVGFADAVLRLAILGIQREPAGSVFLVVPWWLLTLGWRKQEAFRERQALGPEVPDEVDERPSADAPEEVLVLASRRKTWNPRQTIRYRDRDWRLDEAVEVRLGPRKRFRYRLVPHPEAEIIRSIVLYDPEADAARIREEKLKKR